MVPDEAVAELGDTWRGARERALRDVLPDDGREEDARIRDAMVKDASLALSAVRTHSETAAQHFRKRYGEPLSLVTLPMVLNRLKARCIQGAYVVSRQERTVTLHRPPSCDIPTASRCGWWKAATAGLVNGLTCGVSVTRGPTAADGAAQCHDAFRFEPPAEGCFETAPPDVQQASTAIQARLRSLEPDAALVLLGMANGRVVCRLATGHPKALPVLESVVRGHFQRHCQRDVQFDA